MTVDYTYWDDVFNKTYKDLYTYAYTLLHNADAANDIVSEAFIVALMHSNKYECYDNIYGGLKSTINNLFRETARKSKKEKMSFEEFYRAYYEESITDVAEVLCHCEEEKEMKEALETLRESDRHIIFLHYYRLLLFVQIAGLIRLKYTTVLYRHQRALSELHFYFTGEYSSTVCGGKRKNMMHMRLLYLLYLVRR